MNQKIVRINQKDVKRLNSPYNQLMDPDGPKIVEQTSRSVTVFDGWQNLPKQKLDPEQALENAKIRAMSIQRHQARKGLVYFNKVLGRKRRLQESDIIDLLKPDDLVEEEDNEE